MSHILRYLDEVAEISQKLDREQLEQFTLSLLQVRERKGRLFLIGVGGSAGNCSHAVNDFRKLGGFEAYSPVDNVPELTARTNDEGWHTVFEAWLRGSRLTSRDAVLVLSVGGGDKERNISANIVYALEYAKQAGATILGIVGRDGGFTAQVADVCVIIPPINPDMITPHTEAFHMVILHMIIADPRMMVMGNKWESSVKEKVHR
ncbi:MAG: sugar isomerase [Candidatus Omnitrophica bacterium CG11_big_fil_rev_8_21_14_0_20_45_26]|uniref:Sugar isomerase n=1 Tax=Candidatus Abzuiibacterium crystallinum TaxID=1974748 RepID=A0A2H0LLI0_9BACT|nr:MAG: sugar isomerase [Candidatus Omnitrophica bacterium CG11_big_fil_rev_8_21_14_0_20_45_26]PIW64496.1 MAG: sugar isomerase [Candidatus Omnitrophica bacterium CG12_big_fil_rev_8_21_14_0_65_45_16]